MIQFFCTCIRPITEYAFPVYLDGLPSYLSEDLEVVQKRGIRIIHPELSYEQALAKSDLWLLSTRRQEITDRLFQSNIKDNDHKLKKNSCPTSVNIIITYVDSGNSNKCLKLTD